MTHVASEIQPCTALILFYYSSCDKGKRDFYTKTDIDYEVLLPIIVKMCTECVEEALFQEIKLVGDRKFVPLS